MDYIKAINKEYGTKLIGLSGKFGNKVIPKDALKYVVRDFGNGLGRVLYVDRQNKLIANNMELLENGSAGK